MKSAYCMNCGSQVPMKAKPKQKDMFCEACYAKIEDWPADYISPKTLMSPAPKSAPAANKSSGPLPSFGEGPEQKD